MLLQTGVPPTMAAVPATWNINFWTHPAVWLCCAARARGGVCDAQGRAQVFTISAYGGSGRMICVHNLYTACTYKCAPVAG